MNHLIVFCSFVSMLFTTALTLKQYLKSSVPNLISNRVHDTMATCLSISGYIAIYMERGETMRTMIPTGLLGFLDLLFTIDTGERFIYFLHYIGSNAKATKRLNELEFWYVNLSLTLQHFVVSTLIGSNAKATKRLNELEFAVVFLCIYIS